MTFLCSAVVAAPVSGAGLLGAQSKDGAASESAGAAICATCHQEVSKQFADNPHSRLATAHGTSGVTCENCHGAGKAHADSGGDAGKIFNPAKASAKEVDARCLSCHQGQHAGFEQSGNAGANVACTGCHSVHSGEDKAHLLKAAAPKLCFQCHADVQPQFAMPFHHKVEEGQVKCNDCHNPHGESGSEGLKAAAQQDAVCTKCHAEKAGPFVNEHAAIKAEGCTACHAPHGGSNPHLLNRANVNTICEECHSPSQISSKGQPIGPGHNLNQLSVACTSCHVGIHGSNTSPVFLNGTE